MTMVSNQALKAVYEPEWWDWWDWFMHHLARGVTTTQRFELLCPNAKFRNLHPLKLDFVFEFHDSWMSPRWFCSRSSHKHKSVFKLFIQAQLALTYFYVSPSLHSQGYEFYRMFLLNF